MSSINTNSSSPIRSPQAPVSEKTSTPNLGQVINAAQKENMSTPPAVPTASAASSEKTNGYSAYIGKVFAPSIPSNLSGKAVISVVGKALNSSMPTEYKQSAKEGVGALKSTMKMTSNFVGGEKISKDVEGKITKSVASCMSQIPRFGESARNEGVGYKFANAAWGAGLTVGGVVLCAACPVVIPCAVAGVIIHSKFKDAKSDKAEGSTKAEGSSKAEAAPKKELNATEKSIHDEIAGLRSKAQSGVKTAVGLNSEIPGLTKKLDEAEKNGHISPEFRKVAMGEISKFNEDGFNSRLAILKSRLGTIGDNEYKEATNNYTKLLKTESKDSSKNISKEFVKNFEVSLKSIDAEFAKIQATKKEEIDTLKTEINSTLKSIKNNTIDVKSYQETFQKELNESKKLLENKKSEKALYDEKITSLKQELNKLPEADKIKSPLHRQIDENSVLSDAVHNTIINLDKSIVIREQFVKNLPTILKGINENCFEGIVDCVKSQIYVSTIQLAQENAAILQPRLTELQSNPKLLKELETCQNKLENNIQEARTNLKDPLSLILECYYSKTELLGFKDGSFNLKTPDSFAVLDKIVHPVVENGDLIGDFSKKYHKEFFLVKAKSFDLEKASPEVKQELAEKFKQINIDAVSVSSHSERYYTQAAEYLQLLEKHGTPV